MEVIIEHLVFDNSNDCIQWRVKTLIKARENLEIGIIKVNKSRRALGEPNAQSATSAIEVAKKFTYTHTLRYSDDDSDNNVEIGKVISILKAFRGGKPSALTPYFAVGDPNKGRRNLNTRDYDSAMMIMETGYDYESVKKLAAELKEKYGLSGKFPTFTEDSYKTPTKLISANEIHRMCKLSKEDLHDEVRAFMDENCTHLTKN
jgi:hypothetical protein